MAKASILFLLSIPYVALSQEQMPGRENQNRFPPVSFEAVRLFGPDTSKAYVNIYYRIPRSFFVFVRPSDPAAPRDEFVARGQLQVELFNAQDVSVAREIRPISVSRKSLPQTEEQQGDIEGAIPFTLAGGKYQIVFEVDDLESGRSFVDKKESVTAQLLSVKSLDLSPPFFATVDSSQREGIRFFPFNHGHNIFYGNAQGGMVSQIYCPNCDSVLKVHWTMHGHEENQSEEMKDFSGSDFELTGGLLDLAAKEGPVAYKSNHIGPAWKILYVPIPLGRLEPGQYKLKLDATDGKEHFNHEMTFDVVWPNRPHSLMDWDIATDALRYIAKPEEMDKILSSSVNGREEFKAFWRKRDPDTTTAYNDIMVEYYRRVDEAIRQFSTAKEEDGYKTDRGRIYILDGPPTKVERSVPPGQPAREIWTYDSIRKQFVFAEKNKSGNYFLIESNSF